MSVARGFCYAAPVSGLLWVLLILAAIALCSCGHQPPGGDLWRMA